MYNTAMSTTKNKATRFLKREEHTHRWHLMDADGKTLGRLASKAAMLIMGKHKSEYTPNVDCGDYVVVVNSEKVKLTGKKWDEKLYRSYSGYPGGLTERNAQYVLETTPEKLIEWSVYGMLPKTRLGARLFQHLKVYRGPEHPHKAQNPAPFDV